MSINGSGDDDLILRAMRLMEREGDLHNLAVSTPLIGGLYRRLRDRGYMTRNKKPNARAFWDITPLGKAFLEAAAGAGGGRATSL